MFRMSHDAVDFFSADFTAAGVIVAGEEYPLGYFAAEALEVSGQLTLDIGAAAKEFAAEAQMFFAARDPSSAGIANEAFRRLWHLLRKLPLYDLLLRREDAPSCFTSDEGCREMWDDPGDADPRRLCALDSPAQPDRQGLERLPAQHPVDAVGVF